MSKKRPKSAAALYFSGALPATPTYSNTPLSIHDIIRMLRDNRGLIINDEPSAERQLSIIGYFRLANYMLPIKLGNRTPLEHQINGGVALLPKQVCQVIDEVA